MWTTSYIISQIFAFAWLAIFGTTFLIKNKKLILVLNIIASFCLAFQYLFLKAYTGMVSAFISVVATIWFLINEKLNRKKDYISLCTISLLYLGFGIFTFNGWVDIFVIIASIGFNYAIWQSNVFIYRVIGMFVSLFWLVYDIFYFTIIQMISDSLMFVIKAVGFIKLLIERRSNLNKNPPA